MATEVYTKSFCSRCGEENTREGAEASYPPVGWARFALAWRGPGTGWSRTKECFEGILCPPCAQKAKRLLKKIKGKPDA